MILGGSALVLTARFLLSSAADVVGSCGLLAACIGLVVFVIGTITARRKWESEQRAETDKTQHGGGG